MSDKLLVEVDLHNGQIDDALPGLIFLTNELYEAGVFEVSSRCAWNEKFGSDYSLKWRFTEDDEFVETIPVEYDFLLQMQSMLEKLAASDEEDRQRLIFIQKRIGDYVKSAEMSLLCDQAA